MRLVIEIDECDLDVALSALPTQARMRIHRGKKNPMRLDPKIDKGAALAALHQALTEARDQRVAAVNQEIAERTRP